MFALVAALFWRELGHVHRRIDESNAAQKESAVSQGTRIGAIGATVHTLEIKTAESSHLIDDVAFTRAEVAGIARKLGSTPAMPAMRTRSPSRSNE